MSAYNVEASDSVMTLEEAIAHAYAKSMECVGQCSIEHRQLYNWLVELKQRRETESLRHEDD